LDHTSSAVILLGIGFGFFTVSVHKITEWIVSAPIPAFVAPNVLKWHWWRFNSYGFFAGMVAGTVAAVLKLYVNIHPVFGFLLILAVRFAASIILCLLTHENCRAPGSQLSEKPGFQARHVQYRGRARVANQRGDLTHIPGHPALERAPDFSGRLPVDVRHPEIHLVR
jgi:Na+/proline symporter